MWTPRLADQSSETSRFAPAALPVIVNLFRLVPDRRGAALPCVTGANRHVRHHPA
jgi:hypothetical protein